MHRIFLAMASVMALVTAIPTTCAAATDSAQALIDAGKARIAGERATQERIDDITGKTASLAEQYTQVLRTTADLEIYEHLLDKQLANQDGEIAVLNDSIANATLIERQLLPLLTRMADALHAFIELDIPFLIEERLARAARLRDLLERADLTTAEKCRRVLEAYQIEDDYGRTIEAYKGQLQLEDGVFDVDFLRVGRVSLSYRDASGARIGTWNQDRAAWQALSAAQYRRHLAKGLKVARQEMAPEIFTVPLAVSKERHP